MPVASSTAMPNLSVIICAHNPRPDHLTRALEGLRRQTVPFGSWELVIVDNGSEVALSLSCDLSWHPKARIVAETKLGLSWARLRGIEEALSELIVFVDDDNVLDPDYLAEAIRISSEWPSLGVWGSGSIRGEFEVEPQEHVLSWLPVREMSTPKWSNLAGSRLFGHSPEDAIPWGAGLCVRKQVAKAYSRSVGETGMQITGRKGTGLLAGEDTEIAFICCGMGLGVGIFPQLRLLHLIPARRVTDSYITRFAEGTCLSNFLMEYKWKSVLPPPTYGLKTLLVVLKSMIFYRGMERDLRFAWIRALAKANKIIASVQRTQAARPKEVPAE